MKSSRLLLLATVLLAMIASPAPGQGSAARPGTWGFVNVRYDARSSSSIYTGYGWGPAFAMAGVVHNPRSGYAELTAGIGASFRTGARAEHWLVAGSGRTGDASIAQLYWLPKLRMGALIARATVKWEIPSDGGQELGISPLTLTLPFAGRVAGGVAMDLAAAEGARPSVRPGIQLRLRLPGALIGADALRDVRGNTSRFRLHFATTFR